LDVADLSTISTDWAFSGSSASNVDVPRMAAATVRPARSTPWNEPSVTFHAMTAWSPVR
jgi:hypothetical protein